MDNSSMKCKNCDICRMGPRGLVPEALRNILCTYCVDGSNFEHLTKDDIEYLEQLEMIIPVNDNKINIAPSIKP
jgi:hypothetical protein